MSSGFAKSTVFRWLGLGMCIFGIVGFLMPLPESMLDNARDIYMAMDEEARAQTSVYDTARRMQLTLALLAMCVIFFATEAVPLPAVALIIGLVQLFFGITPPSRIVASYAHDAVWFIAGSLALSGTFIKYGLDKRIGMLVVRFSGTHVKGMVFGILIGTSIPSAFIGGHAVAGMFLPIIMALYTLTNKTVPAPKLGKLLALCVAYGCMMGGPMAPTGGARNAIMIGFLTDFGIEISFLQWLLMGFLFTLVMAGILAMIMPLIFRPEVRRLDVAAQQLRKDLEKHGKMTRKQYLVGGVMLFVIFLWMTDKTLIRGVLGFSLGMGGIAITGAVIYILMGLTTWKDYEEGINWGVVVLYAGAISLGSAFKATGTSIWVADMIRVVIGPLGMDSGIPLLMLVVLLGAVFTNLVSAGATVAIIGPLVLGMAEQSGTSPLMVGLTLALSTATAFWLVIGTPASSIAYSSGLLTSKDYIRGGMFIWPLAVVVIIGVILLFWIPVLGLPVFE